MDITFLVWIILIVGVIFFIIYYLLKGEKVEKK